MATELRTVDLDGPVWYADYGGTGPVIVCVHGLGGSSANWLAVGPALATRARVLAPDLAGHGRTPLAGRSAGVQAGVELVGRFIDQVADAPAILLGNSMGALVALRVAASHPERVAGLILVDPAVPRPRGVRLDRLVVAVFAAYAIRGLGERMLAARRSRFGPEALVRQTLEVCCARPDRIPPEVVDAHIELVRERMDMPWADAAFLQAARSMLRILVRPAAYARTVTAVRAPTLLLQGSADRLVPLGSTAHVAFSRPDWSFRVLAGVGHVPQLEAPDRVVELIAQWLDGPGAAAAAAATPRTGTVAAATPNTGAGPLWAAGAARDDDAPRPGTPGRRESRGGAPWIV